MSNAGSKNQRTRGHAPGKPKKGSPSLTKGVNPYPILKKDKDDLRSKILKLTEKYKSLCSSPPEGKRFRVRAEILLSGEEYLTVEMSCQVANVIQLPWAEYGSAELEIRYGSQLERLRTVLMMVRRAPGRLGKIGYNLTDAVRDLGTPTEKWLSLSGKDYDKKSSEERKAWGSAVRPQSTKLSSDTPNKVPPSYNKMREDNAAKEMAYQLKLGQRDWSGEDEDRVPSSIAQGNSVGPHSEKRPLSSLGNGVEARLPPRASSSAGEAPPRPTTSGQERRVPPPSSSANSGRRAPPPATSVG